MTLNDRIQLEFNRMVALGSAGPEGDTMTCDLSVGQLRSDIVAVDAIGCSFTSFSLDSDKLRKAPLHRLKEISDWLSSRLSYLLEPIALVESDEESCILQMRSNPPQKEDNATSYYELVVSRNGQLSLCRFTKSRGSARETISAHVTREVFCRLAADFEAAVDAHSKLK